MGLVDAFSFAGGLFGAIIPFVAIFMEFYNKQHYELKVAEVVLRFDKERNLIASHEYSFWMFVKYTTFLLLTDVFCFECKSWTECHRMNNIFKEVNYLMGINNLLTINKNLEDQNKIKLLNLLTPFSFDEAEESRLVKDYYHHILEESKPFTYNDLWIDQLGDFHLDQKIKTENEEVLLKIKASDVKIDPIHYSKAILKSFP